MNTEVKTFQAEETVHVRSGRPETVWHVQETTSSSIWLEHEGKRQEKILPRQIRDHEKALYS